jgi:hypothetical protein
MHRQQGEAYLVFCIRICAWIAAEELLDLRDVADLACLDQRCALGRVIRLLCGLRGRRGGLSLRVQSGTKMTLCLYYRTCVFGLAGAGWEAAAGEALGPCSNTWKEGERREQTKDGESAATERTSIQSTLCLVKTLHFARNCRTSAELEWGG